MDHVRVAWYRAPPRWAADCATAFVQRLDDPLFAIFVVNTGSGGLTAWAAGTCTPRLPSPGNSAPYAGHIGSVATDPAHRRHGHGRACVTAARDRLAGQGCTVIDLYASADGRPLYDTMGFVVRPDVAMIWCAPSASREW
ncbi:GNAT family N-acetyltransferase [Streptomyces sp. NPDC004787]|uniref:GNAT family N-acetyltransferase n=1 Tax=Streptomyces sp. NPDC004787 TaxID=3154291 RepID=UPI0033AE14BB